MCLLMKLIYIKNACISTRLINHDILEQVSALVAMKFRFRSTRRLERLMRKSPKPVPTISKYRGEIFNF